MVSLALTALASLSFAQQPVVYATGLSNPSKIITGAAGNLIVTEADDANNSGRISVIAPGGQVRAILKGLPSAKALGDVDGPNGLAISGRTLYLTTAEGDAFVAGPTQGTNLPNPAGPSSPLFSSVLKVTFSDDIERIQQPFTLTPADHYTILDGNTVTLDNGNGAKASVELLNQFRFAIPDPRSIYRNSHPYGLAIHPATPDTLYVNDSGMNTIVAINLTTGRSKVVTRFPVALNPEPLANVPSEAVPTSVRPYGNRLLVSLLGGAPFVPGSSRVMELDPATGTATPFITWLSSTIDVLPRIRPNAPNQFYTLEFSLGLLQGRPGRLMRYSPEATTLSETLPAPTAMTIDEAAGNLYVTSRATGSVYVFKLN